MPDVHLAPCSRRGQPDPERVEHDFGDRRAALLAGQAVAGHEHQAGVAELARLAPPAGQQLRHHPLRRQRLFLAETPGETVTRTASLPRPLSSQPVVRRNSQRAFAVAATALARAYDGIDPGLYVPSTWIQEV